MQKTYNKSKDQISQTAMSGASDFLAKMLATQESRQDSSTVNDPACSLRLSDYFKKELGTRKRFLKLYSLRTLKTCYQLMADGDLPGCKLSWTKQGTTSNGQLLTLPRSFLKTERVYIIGHLRKECTAKVFPIIGQSRTANQKQSVRVVGHYGNQKHQSNTVISDQGASNTLSATDYKHPQVVVHQIGNVSKSKSFGGNPQVGRVYATDGLAPTLNTMQGGGRQPKIIVKRPLKGKTRNGWHFEQECYSPDSITGTLKAGGGSGNIPKIVKSRINSQAENYVIRKLTPKECWRLQGFDDKQFYKAKNAGLSNTQLYKQAGNSVTVPVIKAIAERLE